MNRQPPQEKSLEEVLAEPSIEDKSDLRPPAKVATGDASRAKRAWMVLQTFGPVMSHGGFKNWYLCLARDGIVAVPVGIWPSIVAGIGAGMGIGGEWDYARPSSAEGERILLDDGNPRWRRYPAGQIDQVFMKRCLFGANEIHLRLVGQKKHVYGLGDRGQTDACRAKLRQLFLAVYSERGFRKAS